MTQEKLQVIIEAQDRTNKAIEKIAGQMDKAEEKTKRFQGTLTKLGGVLAGAFAVGKLTSFTQNAIQAGLAGEQVAESFYRMSAAAGTAGDDLVAALKRASAGTVAETDIMLAANRSMALNVTSDIGEMADLMEIARVRGRALGLDTTQSFNDIVTGIGRGSPLILDNLGIITKGWAEEAQAAGVAYDAQFILNKVLEQGREELEAMGEVQLTAAERTQILSARYSDFQSQLGQAFLPTLEVVMDGIMNVTDGMVDNGDRMNKWAEHIYRVTNFLIAMAKGAKVVIDVMTALGDIIFSLGKGMYDTFSAVAKAMEGDFKGAWESLKDGTVGTFDEISEKMGAWKEVIADDFAAVGESAIKAIDLNGFTPLENRIDKATTNITKKVEKMAEDIDEKALKEASEAVQKLGTTFSKVVDDIDDNLYELKQSHKEKMGEISKTIANVRQKISDLNSEYAKTRASNTKDVAASVVENEERIAEIQKELQGDVSRDRKAELEGELAEREAAMKNNAAFLKSIDREVIEARRVAALSDLERAIEDYKARQAAARADYNQRKSLLDQELDEAKDRKKEEEDLYREKLEFIKDTLEKIVETGTAAATSNVLATKEQVEKEIEYYQALAEAIKAARSGNASGVSRIRNKVEKISAPARAQGGPVMANRGYWVGERGPEYFSPTSNGKILPNGVGGGPVYNIYLQGNHFLGKEGVARQIGNELIRELQHRQKVKY